MISTNNFPSNLANAVAPFNAQGGRPVGEENPENRHTPFKPVEESAETARIQPRRNPQEQNAASERRSPTQDAVDAEREDTTRQNRVARQQEAAEQKVIDQLAARDREVRAHEQAHKTAGGALAGAASYQYERGPDGVSYAVAGEVPIKLSSGSGDPEKDLAVARQVQQAALAPAEPSVQDRQVAAQAAQLEQQALQDIAELERQEAELERQQVELEREQKEAEAEAEEQARRDEERALAERERLERNSQIQQRQSEAGNRLVDVNQRLLDIGVGAAAPDAGSFINSRA